MGEKGVISEKSGRTADVGRLWSDEKGRHAMTGAGAARGMKGKSPEMTNVLGGSQADLRLPRTMIDLEWRGRL